ncbi:MAG: M1 family metallopeptidase, partial [Ilumatobacteraceae bacterium]
MTRRLLALACAMLVTGCAAAPGVQTRRADQHSGTAPAPSTNPDDATTAGEPPMADESTGETTADVGDGVGDELFPELGNPGLDVQHYDVDLHYDPATDVVEGSVGLDVLLTESRDEITLDSAGPEVSTVTVDGAEADVRADGPELRITLPGAGSAGDELRVEVTYRVAVSTTRSAIGLPVGWYATDGGSYVLNEPDGARTWLPCNDHPSDKASYTFTLSVPTGLTAVANGELVDHRSETGGETWVWQEDRPMATYLIQLLTGDYDIIEGEGPNGLPLVSVVLHDDRATMQPYLDVTPDMIAFFERYFGAYPLDRYGIAITDSFGGLAMETQERSLFSRQDFSGDSLGSGFQEQLLAHELAHQWFGDAVSPARWQDIWLNESFATYGEWMWSAGGTEVSGFARDALSRRNHGSSADPSVEEMFGFNSYGGGAAVLHALRLTMGDDTFFELLRR